MELGEAHQRIREIRPPAARPPVLHLDLKPARRSGDVVLRTRDLGVGYPDFPLFTADDVTLDRGERVAIIGPNGAGKTTLLRTLLGDLQPLEGEIRFGQSVTVGYFAQAHDALHSESTVLDELMRHKQILPREARDHLARYLFRGDDVFKAVGALSGGERARLALAILALEGVNVLVLDEPTNHLDIFAQEVLQEGLESFDGTLLLVSHDRYLVRAIATQIWNVCDGHMSVFKGTYAEFEAPAPDAQPNGKAPATARGDVRLTRNEVKPTLNGAQSAPDETRQTRNEERTERRRQRLLSALEEKIAEAERDLAEYGRRLESGSYGGDFVEASRLSEAYATTQARVEQLLSEWEAVAAE
jgi:ATP-binding cassette subfamily F protein 3